MEEEYLLYLGCLIPYRIVSYEVSARKVSEKMGLKLVDMPDFNCCGLPLDPVNHEMMLALAARNLCIAEQEELNIMTLCNGCAGTLQKVNRKLKSDSETRDKVNGYLKEIGMKFEGKIEVKHFIQVLYDSVGLDNLRALVSNPLKGYRVALHYGCHILRPSKTLKFDDPEDPEILRKLIEVTGAEVIEYAEENQCCGAPIIGINADIPLQLTRNKLRNIAKVGAESLVTICPSCYLMLDANQPRIERTLGERFNIPVLHYPELLALAMGLKLEDLALKDHKVDPSETMILYC